MKTIKCFLAILIICLFIFGANEGLAENQMIKWYFPGKSVDFSKVPPEVSDLEGPKSGYVSDGICWSKGQTLFYIIDQYAYDRFGDIIPLTYRLPYISFKYDDENWWFFCWSAVGGDGCFGGGCVRWGGV